MEVLITSFVVIIVRIIGDLVVVLRNYLNIAVSSYMCQFDCFGYSSPVKRTSNEATGTLDRGFPLFSFYTGLAIGLHGWRTISTDTGICIVKAFLQLQMTFDHC